MAPYAGVNLEVTSQGPAWPCPSWFLKMWPKCPLHRSLNVLYSRECPDSAVFSTQYPIMVFFESGRNNYNGGLYQNYAQNPRLPVPRHCCVLVLVHNAQAS